MWRVDSICFHAAADMYYESLYICLEGYLIYYLMISGVICMELAKLQCDSHFLSVALKSLKRAKGTFPTLLPIVSLLLAQVEGSFGSQTKWENNLQLEWFSWPPGLSH